MLEVLGSKSRWRTQYVTRRENENGVGEGERENEKEIVGLGWEVLESFYTGFCSNA